MAAIVSTRILRLQAISPRTSSALNLVTAYSDGPVSIPQIAAGEGVILSCTITTDGEVVRLNSAYETDGGGLLGGAKTNILTDIYRGGTNTGGIHTGGVLVASRVVNLPDGTFSVSLPGEDAVAAGTYTYFLCGNEMSTYSWDLYKISFSALESRT